MRSFRPDCKRLELKGKLFKQWGKKMWVRLNPWQLRSQLQRLTLKFCHSIRRSNRILHQQMKYWFEASRWRSRTWIKSTATSVKPLQSQKFLIMRLLWRMTVKSLYLPSVPSLTFSRTTWLRFASLSKKLTNYGKPRTYNTTKRKLGNTSIRSCLCLTRLVSTFCPIATITMILSLSQTQLSYQVPPQFRRCSHGTSIKCKI